MMEKNASQTIFAHYMLFFMITIVLTADIFAQSPDRNWKVGYSGKVKWSNMCDFSGGDYHSKLGVLPTKCEELCLADKRCTHFTTKLKGCFLKESKHSILKEKSVKGPLGLVNICGYVIDRVFQKVKPKIENHKAQEILASVAWRSDGNGTYKWSNDCDYPRQGADLGNVSMGESMKCGSACYAHKRCTHFALYKGKCYLKTINGPVGKPIYVKDGICGFIIKRKLTENWLSSHNGRINSSTNCDFPGYDIDKIILTSNNKTVCPDKCLANKRCTHFVHSTPILPHQCILKEIRGKPVVEIVNEKVPVCGYIV